MGIKQRFFKHDRFSTDTNTQTPNLIHMNNRGDYAIALLVIDTFISSKNSAYDNLARILLSHAECDFSRKKTDVLITPAKYMRTLCLETDHHILIGSIAKLLNHIAIETILDNAWDFRTLLTKNSNAHELLKIFINPIELNPWLFKALKIALPMDICVLKTENRKTIPHINGSNTLQSNTKIILHRDEDVYLIATIVNSHEYFKGLCIDKIPPYKLSLGFFETITERLQKQILFITDKQQNLHERKSSTQKRLKKHIKKAELTEADLISIYSEILSKNITCAHYELSKSRCYSHSFPIKTNDSLTDELEEAIAFAIASGELHDFTQNMQHNSAYT